MAFIFGCNISRLPMKYLCLLLGALFKSKFTWDDVLEKKMELELASWKIMYLSKGDRIALNKTILSNFLVARGDWGCN